LHLAGTQIGHQPLRIARRGARSPDPLLAAILPAPFPCRPAIGQHRVAQRRITALHIIASDQICGGRIERIAASMAWDARWIRRTWCGR